jgi:hypothetical protein
MGRFCTEGHSVVDHMTFVLHCCSGATLLKLPGMCLKTYHLIQDNRFARRDLQTSNSRNKVSAPDTCIMIAGKHVMSELLVSIVQTVIHVSEGHIFVIYNNTVC